MRDIQPPQNAPNSISETLEHLAAASQRLADLAASGLDGSVVNEEAVDNHRLESGRQVLSAIFDADSIEGYDGSEAMERARVAHFNAALEMYTVLVENQS